MKAVFISIRHQWCRLIAKGDKTIEVRKSEPKLETPFKCYIYRSGDGRGEVIGEFICDKIYYYSVGNLSGQTITREEMERKSCLTHEELCNYENSAEPKENSLNLVGVFGWNISSLVVYEKPKFLKDFNLNRPPQSWRYVEELKEVSQ